MIVMRKARLSSQNQLVDARGDDGIESGRSSSKNKISGHGQRAGDRGALLSCRA